MRPGQDHGTARINDRAATTAPPGTRPGAPPGSAGTYHPSTALRRALRRSMRVGRDATPPRDDPGPSLSSLAGAATAVGVASGFLEVATMMFQIHGLHWVGLSTMRISRHAAWMVPAAEVVATVILTMALVGPVLAWSAWRRRRRPGARATTGWVWSWAGLVLGTLFFLGPILAVRRLHLAAAMVLSAGAGSRLRRALVRPTPGWRSGSRRLGAIAGLVLMSFSAWQWDRVTTADERAWTSTSPASRAPNLLWIVLDTVRADHMGLHGYDRPTTPRLDQWAGEGIVFNRARAAAPWTLPSHLSMFTGLWPFEHGGRIDRPYFGSSPTMAEHLAAAGYATAGLAANTGMCNATYGLGRGFDSYVELVGNHEVSARAAVSNAAMAGRVAGLTRALGLPAPGELPQAHRRRAPELIAHAGAWLGRVRDRNEAGTRRPFFLFLNLMDAHSPYVPLAASGGMFSGVERPPRHLSVPEAGWKALHARDAASPDARPARQRELDEITGRLIDLYDDCLRGLDAELGRFLDDLQSSGMLDETWVVIASDHGEEFGEHGIFGHGASLYSQVTHVPMILIPPMGTGRDHYAALRGRRIEAPVSLRDLPATLSKLLLPGSRSPFPGRSLSRFWESADPGPADPILSQMEEQHFDGEEVQMDRSIQMDSVVDDGHLLIESLKNPPELYDLFADPENRRDLADRPEHLPTRERLQRELDALRRGADPGDRAGPIP